MSIKIFYQNVRGLRSKLHTFKQNVTNNNYDVICITESWLNNSIYDFNIIDPENYSIFRRDREDTRSLKKDGGGAFIAVKNDLNVTLLRDYQSDAEDVWISVDLNNKGKLIVCCVKVK